MKHLSLITALSAVILGVSAAELTMTPRAPWKNIAPNEFAIDYDGGKTWPALTGKLPEMKAGTFAKITWEAKAENGVSDNFIAAIYPNSKKNFQTFWTPSKNYEQYTIYLFISEDIPPVFRFSMNPGKPEKLTIRNVQIEEVTPEALGKNLFPDGDFEHNSLPVFFQREGEKHEGRYNGGEIVPSPAFLSGKNSLKIQGNTDNNTVFISERVPAIPGKTAVLKFWAKADANAPLRTVMNMEGLMNKGGKHLYLSNNFKIGTEWQEFTFEFPIPTDKTTYQALNDELLFLQFHWNKNPKAPTLYLDNIEYFLR